MFKAFLPGYIICFALYILFSRQPDYFDGEIANGKISVHSASSQKYTANFREGSNEYNIDAGYILRSYTDGEPVQVIFDKQNPEKAVVYSWWGYWLTPGEFIASILIPVAFWFITHAITRNPVGVDQTVQEEDGEERRRPKYDV